MLIGIYSDIHSNYEAITTVMNDMDKRDVGFKVCLGDIVGYGASVNETVAIIAENSDIVLVGNHDKAAIGELDISGFNPLAKEATLWTQKVLSNESRRFLKCHLSILSTSD